MRLMTWLIAQASLLAVILSISLSGFGMAQTHTAMALDASMDHSMHADMDHVGHDMASTDHGSVHDGHVNCPMIACCHTGGNETPLVPALADVITCQQFPSAKMLLNKAEPESAKKPPKHA